MNEELFFFTIGAAFVYGQSMSSRIWHVVSLIVFHVFVYSLIIRKASENSFNRLRIFRFNEVVVGAVFLVCEYLFVKRRRSMLYLVVEKASAVVMLAGYFLSLYSVFELCKRQTKEKNFTRLGIYRYVRHPFYLGIFIFAVGVSVYLTSYVSAVLIVLYMFTKARERIIDEEKIISKNDASYVEYQKTVASGFFI